MNALKIVSSRKVTLGLDYKAVNAKNSDVVGSIVLEIIMQQHKEKDIIRNL